MSESKSSNDRSFCFLMAVLLTVWVAFPTTERFTAKHHIVRAEVDYSNDFLPVSFRTARENRVVAWRCGGLCVDQIGLVENNGLYQISVSRIPFMEDRIVKIVRLSDEYAAYFNQ